MGILSVSILKMKCNLSSKSFHFKFYFNNIVTSYVQILLKMKFYILKWKLKYLLLFFNEYNDHSLQKFYFKYFARSFICIVLWKYLIYLFNWRKWDVMCLMNFWREKYFCFIMNFLTRNLCFSSYNETLFLFRIVRSCLNLLESI